MATPRVDYLIYVNSMILKFLLDLSIIVMLGVSIIIVLLGGFEFQISEVSVRATKIKNPLMIITLLSTLRIAVFGSYFWLNKLLGTLSEISVRKLFIVIGILCLSHVIYTLMLFIQIPFGDQFDFIAIYDDIQNNGAGLDFGRHGHHWHTSAFFLMYIFSIFSDWNLVWEALMSLLFLFLTWILLSKIIIETNKTLRVEHGHIIVLFVGILFFSFNQSYSLLWTWQLAVFINIFGATVMIYYLLRINRTAWYFLPGVLGAFLATHSFSTGFALWPIGLLIIVFQSKNTKERTIMSVLWIIITLATIKHFASTGAVPATNVKIEIWRIFEYCIAYIGSPAAFGKPAVAFVIGLLGIVAAAYLVVFFGFELKRNRRHILPYICLTLYGLGCALLTAMGRFDLGMSHALVLRYFPFSNFFWFGLIGMLVLYLSKKQQYIIFSISWSSGRLVSVYSCIFLMFLCTGIASGQRSAMTAFEVNSTIPKILSLYPDVPEPDLEVLSDPLGLDHSRIALKYLYKERLNIFREHFQ